LEANNFTKRSLERQMKDILQQFGIHKERSVVTFGDIDLIMERMDKEAKAFYCKELGCDKDKLKDKLIKIYVKGRM